MKMIQSKNPCQQYTERNQVYVFQGFFHNSCFQTARYGYSENMKVPVNNKALEFFS